MAEITDGTFPPREGSFNLQFLMTFFMQLEAEYSWKLPRTFSNVTNSAMASRKIKSCFKNVGVVERIIFSNFETTKVL